MEAMLLDQLLTGRNITLAGGIFVVMSVMRYPLKDFYNSRIGQRLLPVIPVALGVVGALAGFCDAVGWKDQVVIGLISGWASAHTFKLGRTSVMGYGLPDSDGDGIPDVLETHPPAPVVQSPATSTPESVPSAAVADAAKKE
jgi:hypothetical protein